MASASPFGQYALLAETSCPLPNPPNSRLNQLHPTYRLRTLPSSRTTHILTLEGSLVTGEQISRCYLRAARQSHSVSVNESVTGGDERHQQHQTEPKSKFTVSERAEELWSHVVSGGEV